MAGFGGGGVPVDIEGFKGAMSRWATGVTIVTSRSGDRIHGMTVSAFTEVSLDPPLVLVCADKSSQTQEVIAEGRVFAVNVLGRQHEALANRFASKEWEDRRFDGLTCDESPSGAPYIPDALVSLGCRVVEEIDAGDHFVYVGAVEDVRLADGDPLLYFGGGYRAFDTGS